MISAACRICGRVTKNPHTCLSCGAVVCADHYDFSSGFCPRCRERMKRVETAEEPDKKLWPGLRGRKQT